MRSPRLILVATLALGGAAHAAPMSRPPGAVSCIDSQSIGSRQAEDAGTLLLGVGSRIYRNHLRTACPGLMRLNDGFATLITETQGSQLCVGDSIRIADSTGIGAVGAQAYPRCMLGWFELLPKPAKAR
jgi:hypothetical protein